MNNIEPTGATGGNDVAGTDQQAFDEAVETAQVNAMVGQAVGSLATMHVMDYAGEMLKDEG
ncbi:hypothetical protein ACUY1T_05720 [Billgrantia sp. Q4P2]|uniref:hypothetical protein n=1 Tax=Billgrantia sp. Q4P2 TaxID=3463857 RepID=UPI0040564FD0